VGGRFCGRNVHLAPNGGAFDAGCDGGRGPAGIAGGRTWVGVIAIHVLQSMPRYMTTLRTWSTVQFAGFLTPFAGCAQDLTNEMHSGDLVACKQSKAAFSGALEQGKSPSYMTHHITGGYMTRY